MRTLATKQPNNDSTKQNKKGNMRRSSRSVSPLSTGMPLLQRKCSCGGGCPRCQNEPLLQTKPLIQLQVTGEYSGGLRRNYIKAQKKQETSLSKGSVAIQRQQAEETDSDVSNDIFSPTEQDIGNDLRQAKNWVARATDRVGQYTRVIRLLAQDPQLSYRISQTGSTNLRCAIQANFNLDPIVNSANHYVIRLLQINSQLNRINSILSGLNRQNFRLAETGDRVCEGAGAYVIGSSYPIFLCTGYFLSVGDNRSLFRPATIIHEVAHIADMDDEQYINVRSQASNPFPRLSCSRFSRFSIGSSLTIKNPDSYAFLCADLRASS